MGSLERVVSQISTPPNQAALSQTYQAPAATPQLNQPLQAQTWQSQAPSAPLTLSNNGYTTQISSPTSTAPTPTVQQPQSNEGVPQLSNESAAVVNHFGLEAPAVLNNYATTLEDALVNQDKALNNVAGRAQAMETILTDPDQLADYTNRFFTEVYPVNEEGPAVQAQTQLQGQAPALGQPAAPTQQPYQPQYDQLPAVPAAAGNPGRRADPETQWNGFSQTMNQSPDQAWRYLSQMTPEAIRSKMLFMDAS